MEDKKVQDESLRELAEEAMGDKREEMGNEIQTRELWDVPTESAADLQAQQEQEQ